MNSFDDIILYLDGQGVTDIIVPFIVVFTLIFAVLQKTKILGTNPKDNSKPKKNLNAAIAFVFGISAIIPHFTGVGPDIVNIMSNAFPQVSLLLIAIVGFFLIVGMISNYGWEISFVNKKITPWIIIFCIVAVGYIFLSSAGFIARPPPWLSWLFQPRIRNTLIAIGIFALVIRFITSESEERTYDPEGGIGNTFRIHNAPAPPRENPR